VFQFNNFSGIEGTVTVPGLGAVAGTIGRWSLRREDSGPNAGLYVLHASLSYVNEVLMRDSDFRKEVVVNFKRGRDRPDDRFVVEGEIGYSENTITIHGANVHVKK
jgi:hypothetical protein